MFVVKNICLDLR